MNSILSFFAAPLIAVQIFMLTPTAEKPCEKADLKVLEIWPPDYDEQIQGTTFEVIIKNTGKVKSKETTLKAFDLDISYDEAKKTIKDKETLELIAENNGRAEYSGENEYAEVDDEQLDYDFYWEETLKVKALEPKEEVRITISIKDHWIYDSNCEIRVIVDPKDKVDECDTENNQLDFYGWG